MEEKIFGALSNVLEISIDKEEVKELLKKDDTNIVKEFSLDSLLTVQFIIELEKVFDIEIDMEEINMSIFTNTKELKEEIKKYLRGRTDEMWFER